MTDTNTAIATRQERPLAPQHSGVKISSMELTTMDDIYRLAQTFAASGIVPKTYGNNPDKVFVGIIAGAEVGFAPMQALQSIAVINGNPAIWGDGALALVQASGLLEDIEETDDGQKATCRLVRKGRASPIVHSFDMEDARRAGLLNKDGPWKLYPKRMRQMRARSWALRDGFADVLKGLHIAEEAQDYPNPDAKPQATPLTPDMLAQQAGVTVEQAQIAQDVISERTEEAVMEVIEDMQSEADEARRARLADDIQDDEIAEAAQQTLDDIDGPLDDEQPEDDGPDPREAIAERIIGEIDKCATATALRQLRSRENPHIEAMPEEMAGRVKLAFKTMLTALENRGQL